MTSNTVSIEEYIRYPRFMLEYGGGFPQKNYTILYKILVSCGIAVPSVFCICSFVFLFSHFKDIENLSLVVSLSSVIGIYTYKLIEIHYNRGLFFEILQFLDDPDFQPKRNLQYIMDRNIAKTKRLQILFIVDCAFSIVFFGAGPLFSGWKYDLPFPFPIDVSRSTIFRTIVWIYQVMVAIWATWNHLALQLLLCAFMSIGSGQFEMLSERLKQVTDIIPNSESSKEEELYSSYDNEIMVNLKTLVELHQKIIKYIETVDDMYSFSVLINFLASVTSIAMTTFVFFTIELNLRAAYTLTYFLAIIIEITLICGCGQELLTESTRVSEGCYASKWNLCGPRVRKMLFIINERSKKPVFVTGKGLVYPTLETLVAILKTSYSYCAFMRNLYNTQGH